MLLRAVRGFQIGGGDFNALLNIIVAEWCRLVAVVLRPHCGSVAVDRNKGAGGRKVGAAWLQDGGRRLVAGGWWLMATW